MVCQLETVEFTIIILWFYMVHKYVNWYSLVL